MGEKDITIDYLIELAEKVEKEAEANRSKHPDLKPDDVEYKYMRYTIDRLKKVDGSLILLSQQNVLKEIKEKLESGYKLLYIAKAQLRNIQELYIDINALLDTLPFIIDSEKEIKKIMRADAISARLGKDFGDEKKKLQRSINIWTICFALAMTGLIGLGVWTIVPIEGLKGLKKLKELEGLKDIYLSLFEKAPFYTAIIWFATYSSKRRSEYNRLRHEYTHKEILAKSYFSYKKEIINIESLNFKEKDKLFKRLLEATIDTISHNPSESLGNKHGDKPPVQEIINLVSKTNK